MSVKRNLTDAHDAIEKLTKSVTSLLGVAALDVAGVYDDTTLAGVFAREAVGEDERRKHGSHVNTRAARRFAEMLVARLIYEPEIVLDWDEPGAQGLAIDKITRHCDKGVITEQGCCCTPPPAEEPDGGEA